MIASSTAAAGGLSAGLGIVWIGGSVWNYVFYDDPSAEEGAEENSDYVEQHGGW